MIELKLLEDLLRRTAPTAAVSKKVEESLRKTISSVVLFLPLADAHRFGLDGVKALERHLNVMSRADLAKLLKKWDQHRKLSAETTTTEACAIAVALLNADAQPLPKPPPKPRRRSQKAA